VAHSLGVAIGLKNNLDKAAALQPWFDFAVNEECFRYGECAKPAPFTLARSAACSYSWRLLLAVGWAASADRWLL
jgi:hypothetical protein